MPRKVKRAATGLIPLSDAILLAGEDRWKHVGRSTRYDYEANGIPAREVADDLVAWFRKERGTVPPADAAPVRPAGRSPDAARQRLLALHAIVDTKLGPVLPRVSPARRKRIYDHLAQQISLLADLALNGLLAETQKAEKDEPG